MNSPNPNDFKGSNSSTDLGVSLFVTIIKMWLVWAAVVLTLGGVGIYVLIHFVSKFW